MSRTEVEKEKKKLNGEKEGEGDKRNKIKAQETSGEEIAKRKTKTFVDEELFREIPDCLQPKFDPLPHP